VKKNGFAPILIILTIVILGTVGYFLYNNYFRTNNAIAVKNEAIIAGTMFGYKDPPYSIYDFNTSQKTQLTTGVSELGDSFYPESQPISLSPNNKYLAMIGYKEAYNVKKTREIFLVIYSIENKNEITSIDAGNIEISRPMVSWSPDSKKLVFSSGISGGFEFWIVDPDGSNLKRLTDDQNYKHLIDWSPDSNKFVFTGGSSGASIHVYDFKTQKVVDINVNDDKLTKELGYSIHPTPSWLNNSDILVNFDVYGLWKVSTDSMQATQVINKYLSPNYPFYLSPDKKQVVFVDADNENVQKSTWISNIDGTDMKLIFDHPVENVYWSPNSQQIAYTSVWNFWTNTSSAQGLWISSNTGDNLKQATDTSKMERNEISDIVWSPDSKKLLYSNQIILGETDWPKSAEINAGTWLYNTENSEQQHLSNVGPPIVWY
jgi:Tol biopolymer transport system component